jgi:hypothetical protein
MRRGHRPMRAETRDHRIASALMPNDARSVTRH